MPELLESGLPDRVTRSKFDFTKFADGRAWKFVKGEDYTSSTETFRMHVRKWARVNGYQVDTRPFPAIDRNGDPAPLGKVDAAALGVCFTRNG